MKILRTLRTWFPALLIGGAFAWSAVVIGTTRVKESAPGTITLRIAHWQLEPGVREALDVMAADYKKIHPNVDVIQEVIPESAYGTWVTTNLIGGTAPDMIQVGRLPWHILVSFQNRYFVPLTPYVGKPNPYNAGTELAKVPLRKTFKDGMRSVFVEELQEFMKIPLSSFGARIFYNKNLLKKLTGLDVAPRDYREFITVCEKIAAQKNDDHQNYVPIAASRLHLWSWEQMMFDPLTYPAVRRVDYNRDGYVTPDELFAGFRSGAIDLNFPAFKARFEIMREVTSHFQTGYTGLGRDEAVFLFAQQRAVFLSTGTWDARGLKEQAARNFDVAVMDFPMPGKDDPKYGHLIEGPAHESPEGGLPIGITRNSKHFDTALNFLLFVASKNQNQKFNTISGWIPAIINTEMDPFLKPFEPHLEGVYSTLNLNLGGETWNRWQQLYSLYQVGQIDYPELVRTFEPYYKERGLEDFLERQRDWRRGMQANEQLLAMLRSRAMYGAPSSPGTPNPHWTKYVLMTGLRQVMPEIEHSRQMTLVNMAKSGERLAGGPYEYSPEVLEKIRKQYASSATPALEPKN